MISGAKLSAYQGIGYAPFFEDAPRFHADFATLVRGARIDPEGATFPYLPKASISA
jgi:hypothetical protein